MRHSSAGCRIAHDLLEADSRVDHRRGGAQSFIHQRKQDVMTDAVRFLRVGLNKSGRKQRQQCRTAARDVRCRPRVPGRNHDRFAKRRNEINDIANMRCVCARAGHDEANAAPDGMRNVRDRLYERRATALGDGFKRDAVGDRDENGAGLQCRSDLRDKRQIVCRLNGKNDQVAGCGDFASAACPQIGNGIFQRVERGLAT
ncbi:hypothetical protein MPL3356_30075 [Mesorhizobium plurifarium]|uniref:Uncharacterized protein n=1 Tax=Mesorhizobium plurifarium TaxID=69974 RepID=A0A090DWT8_MESPL|nr:hypothetical protein MPL3356_30075 [Mesorhizobium plurifarium]